MILELADIRIHDGQQAAFDSAIQQGLNDVISKSKGFRGFKVNQGIESPATLCSDDFLGNFRKSYG